MRRYIFIAFLLLPSLSVYSQVKQEVIASGGGYDVNGTLSLSWTLGETIIPTFKNGDLVLTHGFQQKLLVTAIEENIDIPIDVKVFPNPASEIVTIGFKSPVNGEIVVNILDSQGKIVKLDMIESAMTEKQINLQDVPPGIYYLRLTKGKLVNVYKVIKL